MNIFNVALFSAEYDVGDVVDFDDQDESFSICNGEHFENDFNLFLSSYCEEKTIENQFIQKRQEDLLPLFEIFSYGVSSVLLCFFPIFYSIKKIY